jgi:hypothetical protein
MVEIQQSFTKHYGGGGVEEEGIEVVCEGGRLASQFSPLPLLPREGVKAT